MSLGGEPLFAERFRLGRLLGSGGSSSVYRAEDTTTASWVAVKVLHPHLCQTPAARTAFLREAERLSAVQHPNIAAVVAVGVDDVAGVSMAWIALELIEGPSVATLITERGPLAADSAAEVTMGILSGLAAAHRAGLVHRDIAPHNILLSASADQPRSDQVKLIDFGLADQSGRNTVGTDLLLSETAAGPSHSVVGSVAYLSPEQALGRPVTAAGDLYQAGAVLYFLLTGGPPYPRPSAAAVLRAQVSAPPPVPSALAPGARGLDQVVTTAMAKRPEDRFGDAAAFRDALVRATRTAGPAPARTRVLPAAATPRAGRERNSNLDYLTPPVTSQAAPSRATVTRPGRPNAAAPIAVMMLVAVAVVGVISASAAGGSVHPLPSPSPPASAGLTAAPTPSSSTPPPVSRIEVPPLTGTLTQAEAILNASGLVVGSITKVPSNQPASSVLGQTPRAGTSVATGSRVDLRIASGANLVPDVTNLTVTEALTRLRAAGFDPRSPAGTGDDTLVTGSRPAANITVRLGTTVLITVVGQPSELPTPDPTSSGPE